MLEINAGLSADLPPIAAYLFEDIIPREGVVTNRHLVAYIEVLKSLTNPFIKTSVDFVQQIPGTDPSESKMMRVSPSWQKRIQTELKFVANVIVLLERQALGLQEARQTQAWEPFVRKSLELVRKVIPIAIKEINSSIARRSSTQKSFVAYNEMANFIGVGAPVLSSAGANGKAADGGAGILLGLGVIGAAAFVLMRGR